MREALDDVGQQFSLTLQRSNKSFLDLGASQSVDKSLGMNGHLCVVCNCSGAKLVDLVVVVNDISSIVIAFHVVESFSEVFSNADGLFADFSDVGLIVESSEPNSFKNTGDEFRAANWIFCISSTLNSVDEDSEEGDGAVGKANAFERLTADVRADLLE